MSADPGDWRVAPGWQGVVDAYFATASATLTAKGRAKYNRETGSKLKAPQPEGGKRRDSFCARMGPVAEKSEKGSRARASMKRWNCPG